MPRPELVPARGRGPEYGSFEGREMRTTGHRPARRIAVAAVAIVAVALAACTAPAEQIDHRPLAPTTTVPPFGCSAGAAASSVKSDGAGDDSTWREALDEPLEGAELDAAIEAAVAESDGEPVTVTVVDDDGIEVLTVPAAVADIVVPEIDEDADVLAVEAPVPVRIDGKATDPYRPQQWALDTLAFEAAWDDSTGAGVTIAVIDTGVDGTHPDLAGRVLAGYTKVDLKPGEVGNGNVDENGHGTHVAGIAAAGANDGIGIAGVAPGSMILPVRVLDETGEGSVADVADGVIWAADQGADVINLSLSSPTYSSAWDNAVSYARAKGAVVVGAAGNTGVNEVRYPAGYAGVIGVGATTSTNALASFSTRGCHVDVVAPGDDILSTLPDVAYDSMSGTSMATPHVAGLAALILGAHGDATTTFVEDRITSTAVDLGVPGRDDAFGHGLIDPVAALGD
jgi:subtilisin family serine protease